MDLSFSDKLILPIGRGIIGYTTLAGVIFILFYIIFKKPLWFRKIQQKMPMNRDYKREFFYSFLSLVITGLIGFASTKIAKEHHKVYFDIADHSLAYWGFTIIWMIFVHDTWFYFIHRMMHQPFLYKKVHLIHHKSINPSPWAAFAFHPFEAIMEGLITLIFAFAIPVHFGAIQLYFLLHTIYNIYGHLGYEIYPKQFHKSWIGRWINTSTAHNLHHSKFNGNYGLYFLFWDRMLGTLREDYDDTYEKVTTRQTELINIENVASQT